MATVVGCVALSHSPFWTIAPAATPDAPGGHFSAAAERVRAAVADLAPDAVVIFGPDHARNLFYDCMPPFCIGVERVSGVGDYDTPAGPLPLAADLARAVFDGVTARGFDPAISLDLGIDHGIAQVYAKLFPALDVAMVPIVVNAGCPPLPSFARCAAFGRAVGEVLRAAGGGTRVLLVGSGGLSHWPASISAEDPDVTPQWREFLVHGRSRVAELEPVRRARTEQLAAGAATGRVNAPWDRALLDRLIEDPALLAHQTDADVHRDAGPGALELRTWAAALAAWGGPLAVSDYEPVGEWITGMGLVSSIAPPAREEPA
ncbi:2,3-dihydroxyphenylpropionate 1,2-dioxygenase [Pseudonocardia sp. GCM10023141]|uniref:DODA-type extradiol aromatic ring-opening family dioxygenase n=1 Tax=Pseudonocardia sp. GCM10023141 TaxID=3252653 RepID=UPI0036148EE7